MDVHRSRFVPYPTSAISALAFSRSNDSGYVGPLPALKLALGRENGNIEIWNPQRGSWVQEVVFAGEERSIDGLQWTQNPDDTDVDGRVMLGQYRLFSIGSSPAVTEWDLATGQPKRRSTGNFSEVWCFAAQPRQKPQQDGDQSAISQDLIAGCGDGTLVLLSTADEDLQFKRVLARVSGKGARCMCITYQNRERVVAGFADSMIRIYDTRNGSVVRNMSLGIGIPGAPKNSLVWQVRCLPNGDIVSGDSNGELRIWDGKTYAQTQRIAGHETDCLDLVTSANGRAIFSGSIDGKLAVYRQSNVAGTKSWAKTSHRRVHSGDIKAMAVFDSKGLSTVVSGGSDVTPAVTPLRAYGEENLRTLPSLPQTPPVASAPKARLLVSWWDKTMCIWRVAVNAGHTGEFGATSPRKLVSRITLKTTSKIQSVSVTSDGNLLAASTSTEVKVFQLRKQIGRDTLVVRKINVPDDLKNLGARLLAFSPDGKWLAVTSVENDMYMARLARETLKPKHIQILPKIGEIDRRERKQPNATAFGQYDRTVSRAAFSPDSMVFVVSDLSGYLDSWVLRGTEDHTLQAVTSTKGNEPNDSADGGSDSDSDSSDDDDDSNVVFYGQHWTYNPSGHLLPKLESPPLVMTFRPAKPSSPKTALVNGHVDSLPTESSGGRRTQELAQDRHRLWVMTAKHEMLEFDVLKSRLSDWSRRNPSGMLPADFVKIRDRVMGALWDVTNGRERLWLYGSMFVCMLDVEADLGSSANAEVPTKRKRVEKGTIYKNGQKRKKLESGAGGKIDAARKPGISGTVKRYEDGEDTKVDLDYVHERTEDDEQVDDDEDFNLQLTRLSDHEEAELVTGSNEPMPARKYWCTYKYRPILGMVTLSDEVDMESDKPVEVVIVERPPWGRGERQ